MSAEILQELNNDKLRQSEFGVISVKDGPFYQKVERDEELYFELAERSSSDSKVYIR